MSDGQQDPFGAEGAPTDGVAEPVADPFGAEGGDAEQAPPADDAFGAPAAPVEDAFGAAPVEAADPPAAPMDSVEPANDGGMDAMDQMEPPAAAVDQMPEPAAVPDIPEVPEVNKLTEWEAAWNVELEQKNAEAETLVTTNRSRAQEELERFNVEREKSKEAKQEKNRALEATMQEQMDADLDAANGWERVVKLIDCDTKPEKDGRSDLSRMRSILVQLKNEPLE